ncbi:MAG: I78 family peptidase inhibitor [Paracoccaceae bacterium]
MMTRMILLLVTFAALAACQPQPDPRYLGPPEPAPGVDACGAAELQDMVGDPKTIIAAMTFAVPVRVIEPGMAVTADFSPDRLNFEIAEDGTIAKIACY